MHAFSLVVCRHPVTKLWLAVEECRERGWWLPGGFVEPGDDHFSTAIKETQEEAGIAVELKGILRIENTMTAKRGGRQRVIFYAEPVDPDEEPKTVADAESLRASWMSVKQLQEKGRQPAPQGLRGRELLDWAVYVENGGTVFPLALLSTEETPIPTGRNAEATT
jgi:8-oxo-dGTP pyrophosphatase MutT (NUDIX family)